MTELRDKVVLLTGASRGLGPLIGEALAKRGAVLALAARSDQELSALAEGLESVGATAMVTPVDLREETEREDLIAEVSQKLGPIDVLINNAGIETLGDFCETPWEALCENIEVNLLAVLHLTRLVLPTMRARGSGHIVQIASVAGRAPMPYAATYSAAKAGLVMWTRALRLELAGSGICLSTILPDFVREVGMVASCAAEAPLLCGSCAPQEVVEAVVSAIATNRLETIIAPRRLRLAVAIAEFSPGLTERVMRLGGLVAYQRRNAALWGVTAKSAADREPETVGSKP